MSFNKFSKFGVLINITFCFFIIFCGCVDLSNNIKTVPPVATGYVYLNDNIISGAIVKAISVDGTDYQSNITDDQGTYILNITPAKTYTITATYQGLQHTIWPVYLDNKTDIFNISLTTIPKSTIEGTAYAFLKGTPYTQAYSSLAIILSPLTMNNTTLSTHMGSGGRYSIEVYPNLQYTMSGNIPANFYYHNYPERIYDYNVKVAPNETRLIDIHFFMP